MATKTTKPSEAKVRELVIQALSQAIADPRPKPLHGSKAKTGVFTSSTAVAKEAAQRCCSEGWLEKTGQFDGTAKSRKELYRITPAGIAHAIQSDQTPTLLADMLLAIDQYKEVIQGLAGDVAQVSELLNRHGELLRQLSRQLVPPDLENILRKAASTPSQSQSTEQPSPSKPNPQWLAAANEYVTRFKQRNPYGDCPLPELFHQVAESQGLSIGQFHDGIRQLASEGKIRLHPFTGANYQLKEEQYALMAGQEIKYYVSPAR